MMYGHTIFTGRNVFLVDLALPMFNDQLLRDDRGQRHGRGMLVMPLSPSSRLMCPS
jgi:hypothetical protein